jgi:hypothetical protein
MKYIMDSFALPLLAAAISACLRFKDPRYI